MSRRPFRPDAHPNTDAELTAWLLGSQLRAVAEGGDVPPDASPALLLLRLDARMLQALANAGPEHVWLWVAAGFNAEP